MKLFCTEYTNIHGYLCAGLIEADSFEMAEQIANEKPMKEVVTGELIGSYEISDEEVSTFQN